MASKLIVDFLHDWIRNTGDVRARVLHKERTEMLAEGLDLAQIQALKKFHPNEVLQKLMDEFGLDLDALRHAIYGPDPASGTAGMSTAAYDEGKTHIRQVIPAVVPANTAVDVVLKGQGFKSDVNTITIEFLTGSPTSPTVVTPTLLEVHSDVDVWQRVKVNVTLPQPGDWAIRAHNDDDLDTTTTPPTPIWSDPQGVIHAL